MMRCIGLVAAVFVLLAGCGSTTQQPAAPRVLLDQTFTGDGGPYTVTVDRETYPPHYAGQLHTHPGPGVFCLLEGEITMEMVGQQPTNLRAGQCWNEVPNVAHRPVNASDKQAVAIFYLFAPAGHPRIAPASAKPSPVTPRA